MSTSNLDAKLDGLHERLNAMAASLLGDSPEQIQFTSTQFQLLAVELVQTIDTVGRRQLASPTRVRRIKQLAMGLAMVRENLLRQSAYVDRALELVVPAARPKSTYSGNQTYGSPVRQSGAFTVLSA